MDSLSIRFFFLFLSALPKKRELNFRLPGIESIVKIANLKKTHLVNTQQESKQRSSEHECDFEFKKCIYF